MESNQKKTIGQAIDGVLKALENLEEKEKSTIIKTVCELLGITIHGEQVSKSIANSSKSTETADTHIRVVDIRTFKEEKQPKTAIEMACVVAFYLENIASDEEKKKEIETKDIEKYFKLAKFPLSKSQYVLPNSSAAGYLDSVKHGKYRLNPVGYNLVEHSLPRKGTR